MKVHYDAYKEMFLMWKLSGSLRHGTLATFMRLLRAKFRLSLRFCKVNADRRKNEALARNIAGQDREVSGRKYVL